MLDIRPIVHLIGLLGLVFGVLMLIPAAVDWQAGNDNWHAFRTGKFYRMCHWRSGRVDHTQRA